MLLIKRWQDVYQTSEPSTILQDFFYGSKGYRIKDNYNIDLEIKDSIIIFGTLNEKSGEIDIKHAIRSDAEGFWISKQGSAGRIVYANPESDVNEDYGYPVAQYILKEDKPTE